MGFHKAFLKTLFLCSNRAMNAGKPKEILFEITQKGNLARVTAIDPETGTEVVIQGPASAGDAILKQNAARKLMYVLNKDKDKK